MSILEVIAKKILTPYWSYYLQIFSPSVDCLFVLYMVSFAMQKLLNLIRPHLLIFPFVSFALPSEPPGKTCCCCCYVASVMSDSVQPQRWQPTRLLCPWNSPGKNTGMSCHFLLQRIFLTQGSNPGLLHCKQIPYHLSHQGSPCLGDKSKTILL